MCNFGLGAIESPTDLRDYDYSIMEIFLTKNKY